VKVYQEHPHPKLFQKIWHKPIPASVENYFITAASEFHTQYLYPLRTEPKNEFQRAQIAALYPA
jgi:hypothetical protein